MEPRRYRLALRCLPRRARERYREEIFGLLDEIGEPSWRQAAALGLTGLRLRAAAVGAAQLLTFAGALCLGCALAPGRLWAQHPSLDGAYLEIDGPTSAHRCALYAAAVIALAAARPIHSRRHRLTAALASGTLMTIACLGADWHRGYEPLRAAAAFDASWIGILTATATAAALSALRRAPSLVQTQASTVITAAACAAAVLAAADDNQGGTRSILAIWQLGPAGLTAAICVLLAVTALTITTTRATAASNRDREAP